jgi:hypothetical protein
MADNTNCLQAYQLVWLYVGTYDLAGLQKSAHAQRPGQCHALVQAVPKWQVAAGQLAAQGTPWETLAGIDVQSAGDNVGGHWYLRAL